jgi:hypothetical protein
MPVGFLDDPDFPLLVRLIMISSPFLFIFLGFRNAEKELRLREKEAGYFNIFTEIRWKRVIIGKTFS